MKRQFFVTILIILFTTISIEVFSQKFNSYVRQNIRAKVEDNYPTYLSVSPKRVLLRNEVPSKAIRNFLRTYENVSNVNWFRATPESFGLYGFRAVFADSSCKTRVLFDNKGNIHSIMRYYNEDLLPRNIRHRIKTLYYDYSICSVVEVTGDKETVYTVNLEDKPEVKIIRVSEGGPMIEINEFKIPHTPYE